MTNLIERFVDFATDKVVADVDNTNTDTANLGNNGSDVAVDDNLDLGSSSEIKNASAVSTDSEATDQTTTKTDIGTDTTRVQENYQLATDHSANTLVQKTQVSTTTKIILTAVSSPTGDICGHIVVVAGRNKGNGSTEFVDILSWLHSTAGVTVIQSEAGGSAAGRTYSASSRDLELAMGSDTYEITAVAMEAATVA